MFYASANVVTAGIMFSGCSWVLSVHPKCC